MAVRTQWRKGKKRARALRKMIKGGTVRLAPRRSEAARTHKHYDDPLVENRIPAHFQEEGENEGWLRLGSIMLSILVAGLIWIAIVSWYISDMPVR